jgi:hypothetical protein
MTDTSSLRAFIEARLAEDELWALAASATRDGKTQPGGVHWTWATGDNWDPVQPDPLQPYMGGYDGQWSQAVTLRSVEEWDTSVGPMPLHIADSEELRTADGAHIVRHDPARVLREVAAKRARIELAEQIGAERGHPFWPYAGEQLLKLEAASWSDHPDFRTEWSTA